MNKYECYLTCPRGLENILSQEISEIINKKNIIDNGGVKFNGTKEDIYKLNYHSRVGMNLLIKLFDGNANNIDELYQLIYQYKWEMLIPTNKTFSIRTKINSKIIPKQNFTTLKIKDAIVDKIQKQMGSRPSIDKKSPHFYITVYIKNNKISIFINSSGKPLFMRGYRTKIHKAAINESLASGILKSTNWLKENILYDPMCGSGTFLLEAAMQIFNMPAGIVRKQYAFFNFSDFDNNLWELIRKEGMDNINYNKAILQGSDIIEKNIELCIESAKKLGIEKYIKFTRSDFRDISPNKNKGTVLINPPYGHRIGEIEKLQSLYKDYGDHIKNNFSGFDGYIFTGNLELLKYVGLRTKRKIILKNGKIDCRLAFYPLKKGKY
ncbi:MAG: hypothetical protein CMG64_01205 [Candidatus Marinimicrobia bacterium]|nr:hypothetical protein [Candidatus Neomarinimicrobiota bacterium]|tara:strand:- start:14423 stop:15562 length:1140 start_codon:yes stop_codon:yes gene_type:complete